MKHDFGDSNDPITLFGAWLGEAALTEPNDPNAMTLATVDADGMPDARMVLLKGHDSAGFVFYTNFASAKGRQLMANPVAALCFHWKSLRRQVRVRGPVAPVADSEADAYFDSRARASRIGAWASQQSQPLESRFALEKAVFALTARFGLGAIPRPPNWGGFRLHPAAIEFWHDRPFRLHDRLRFSRDGDGWQKEWLYP